MNLPIDLFFLKLLMLGQVVTDESSVPRQDITSGHRAAAHSRRLFDRRGTATPTTGEGAGTTRRSAIQFGYIRLPPPPGNTSAVTVPVNLE
ncbi:hypothetical protein DPEC_G00344630 [Dallia pectoralis]|uniref:Uncharacterized protein n=1 Tax=Dallia pectoralis TaxID=75939 RepID=A0ACC2F358_DALPE|nr:hypothetical protein DPEC_G00344630 [Dallia pectoralis]